MTVNIKLPWVFALLGICLISTLFNMRFLMNSDEFGVVDIQKMVTLEAEKLATLYPDGNVPLDKLQALTDSLRENLEAFTEKKNLILFSKGAVWSSHLKDYTEALTEALKDE